MVPKIFEKDIVLSFQVKLEDVGKIYSSEERKRIYNGRFLRVNALEKERWGVSHQKKPV